MILKYFLAWSLVVYLLLLLSACEYPPSGISVTEIAGEDINAQLIIPEETEGKPLVLVVPGSGGGFINESYLYGLAEEGYPVISIAYFGQSGLPDKIELIPLEYLDRCIQWLTDRFPGRKIIAIGISRGAEYVLLYASQYHRLDALICYSPTSFVLPVHIGAAGGESAKSSWTHHGKALPFAPIAAFSQPPGTVVYRKYFEPLLIANKNIPGRIPVEKIKCPTLLLTGKADLVWPSFEMAERMTQAANDLMKHISYENAGHQFLWLNKTAPTKVIDSQSMRLQGIKKHRFVYGGTQVGTLHAMMASRKEVLSFLNDYVE